MRSPHARTRSVPDPPGLAAYSRRLKQLGEDYEDVRREQQRLDRSLRDPSGG
jgi:capsid protein